MIMHTLAQGFQFLSENETLLLILQTSLVLLTVWLLTHMSKNNSAALRHLWWSLGLALCLFLPFWDNFGPKILLPILPESLQRADNQPVDFAEMATSVANHDPELSKRITSQIEAYRSAVEAYRSSMETDSAAMEADRFSEVIFDGETTAGSTTLFARFKTFLLAIYFLGVLGLVFQLAVGLWRIAYLTKNAAPLHDPLVAKIIEEIRKDLALRRSVSFLVSPKVHMPFTWGCFRPKILLPQTYTTWKTATLRNVLIHEMAHIKRWDWPIAMTARLSMVLHWFNPLSWKALTRLRLEAERASDDWVLRLGHPATEYADQLLTFIDSTHAQPMSRSAMVAMASGSDFSERMKSILAPSERRHSMKFPHVVCMVLLAFGLTGLMAGVNLAPMSEEALESTFFFGDSALNYRLMDAVQSRDLETTQTLLDSGANVNFKMSGDGSPLIIAAKQSNLRLADMLLQAGADPNLAVSGDGNPLIQAANRGNMEMARMLLDAGADVNRGVKGDGSPLQVAAKKGHLHLVMLFLDADADVNKVVFGDGNPLISAARRGHLDIAQLLLDQGARIDAYVDGDETPLIQAVMGNQLQMVEFLISQGADVNKAVPHNRRGDLRSPMDAAKIRGNEAMIDLLSSHGATETE